MMKFLLFILLASTPLRLSAFPENVRHGYASCKSCHYSPTGGGTLTPYGKRLTEEIQSTWAKPNEADLFYGAVKAPEVVQIGGDIRSIYYKRETETYRESRYFLMQADVEVVAPKVWKDLTAVINGGYYDEDTRLRKAYFLYDIDPTLSARIGLFAPAFGINTPEHETATKRPLGFNEGSEVPSLEFNYTNRLFEVLLTGFWGGKSGDIRQRDEGATLNFAWYLGKSSKVGLSLYSGSSAIHRRNIIGPYAIIGFTEQLYLLSEVDYQKRTIKNKDAALIDDEEGVFSHNKFGWEILQGLHTFLVYETARPTASESNTFFDGYGGGVTWYPRPHFEVQFSYEATKNPGVKRTSGDMYLGMMHYYL